MLDDGKKVKLVDGALGCGKSCFAALVALTSKDLDEETNPTPGEVLSDDELEDRMEKLSTNVEPDPIQESRKKRDTDQTESTNLDEPHLRIMYIVDQNKPFNNMIKTFKKAAAEMRIKTINGEPLTIVRVHFTRAEAGHIPNKYLKLARVLERAEPAASGLSYTILGMITPFMRNADAAFEENGAQWITDVSLSELSYQKFESNKEKYLELSKFIYEVKRNPETWKEERSSILRAVQNGPMQDAMDRAHIVLTTLTTAADIWLRKFKFDAICIEEAARAKESTSLIVFAYYLPRVYIMLGDTRRNPPRYSILGTLLITSCLF